MNGRVYDVDTARFLSADPNIFHPFVTQNFNRYSYVMNNPLMYTDPSGFDALTESEHNDTWGDSSSDGGGYDPSAGEKEARDYNNSSASKKEEYKRNIAKNKKDIEIEYERRVSQMKAEASMREARARARANEASNKNVGQLKTGKSWTDKKTKRANANAKAMENVPGWSHPNDIAKQRARSMLDTPAARFGLNAIDRGIAGAGLGSFLGPGGSFIGATIGISIGLLEQGVYESIK